METDEQKLIGSKKMAELLDISEEGLRQRIYRDKNIPHYKLGGVLKFDVEAVLNYFKRA